MLKSAAPAVCAVLCLMGPETSLWAADAASQKAAVPAVSSLSEETPPRTIEIEDDGTALDTQAATQVKEIRSGFHVSPKPEIKKQFTEEARETLNRIESLKKDWLQTPTDTPISSKADALVDSALTADDQPVSPVEKARLPALASEVQPDPEITQSVIPGPSEILDNTHRGVADFNLLQDEISKAQRQQNS